LVKSFANASEAWSPKFNRKSSITSGLRSTSSIFTDSKIFSGILSNCLDSPFPPEDTSPSGLLVLHHNSTASNTEYAQINSGLNLINFTTDISNSDVRLNAAGSFISCSVRLDRTIIPI